MSLTDLERELLDFAGPWFKYAGAREQEIKDCFGMSAANSSEPGLYQNCFSRYMTPLTERDPA